MEIEVHSPYGTKVGTGPIITGRNWRSSSRMNKIGAFSFEMPLNDPRRSLLVQKRYVRCYGMVNGTRTELGKPGIIDSIVKEIDANGIPTGMLRVSGRDLLAELADINIHELALIATDERTPGRVEYYDGTRAEENGGWWTQNGGDNLQHTYDDVPETSVTLPADDEDWIYVGDAKVWDLTVFDFGTLKNSDSGNFAVEYSTGPDSWGTGTILSDTTKVGGASWAKDGSIRWERQEDWITRTVNGIEDLYWLRFQYSEDMSDDVSIHEIDIIQEIPTTTALADWLAYEDAASPADTPISDLGWAFETDLDVTENHVFLNLRDVSAFEALTLIGEQTGENFRLGTGRKIEWLLPPPTASGIRATNVPSGVAAQDNEDICLITNLRETEDSYEVVSRVYPQGGGRGAMRINLAQCTYTVPGADYTGYTLNKTANYLKKDSVEAVVPTGYDRRIEITRFWPNVVSPNWASARDTNSSNALFDLAYEYLSRHWEPQTSYQFSVVKLVKLDAEVKVGQTIQLCYWQTVEGVPVWNLGIASPLHLWVLEVSQAIDDIGVRVVAMQVATIDAWPPTNANKVKNIVSQIKALQSTGAPISAENLTPGSVAALLASLDLSAYYKKPTDTRVILGLDAGNVPPGNYNAVVIGKEAGYDLTSGADNTYVGYRSGRATTTGYDNTMVGSDAMRLGLGTGNTGVGYRVLENVGTTSDGLLNTAVGHQAMRAMDEGDHNVAMGSGAMGNAQGSYNTGIGDSALVNAGKTSDGDENVAVGYAALEDMDTGEYNVALGSQAMGTNTGGDYNVAVGPQAMDTGAGSNNIAIGYMALRAGTSAVTGYNVAIGDRAGYNITSGVDNIAIGRQAMGGSTTPNNNTVVGASAGYDGSLTTYADCVIIGFEAGAGLDSGDGNVLVGYQAGAALTTGTLNVFIGKLAGSQETTGANKLYIENSNSATPLIYGEFDNDLVRINGNLDVIGNITMATTKFIGITGNEIITFQAAGTIDFTGADVTMDNDLTVTNDILLSDGSVLGIAGNEIITFNAAGTIAITGADILTGAEDGGGKLNFDEGTSIATGIVWGSDANKVTLYRSADDMLKTDDSLTVALGLNVGTATGATSAGEAYFKGGIADGSYLVTIENTTIGGEFLSCVNADGNKVIGLNQLAGKHGWLSLFNATSTETITLNATSGDATFKGGVNIGTATGAGAGEGFFSGKLRALTAFFDGAGTDTAKNTAMSLYTSVLVVQENGAANDQAQITLTFKNTGSVTRNYAHAKLIVRVGYADEAGFAQLASIYEVEIAQFQDGSAAAERYFSVTELCAAGVSGAWAKPGVGGFAWSSSSATTFVFTIQNACAGDVDADVQVFDGLNIASVAAALV